MRTRTELVNVGDAVLREFVRTSESSMAEDARPEALLYVIASGLVDVLESRARYRSKLSLSAAILEILVQEVRQMAEGEKGAVSLNRESLSPLADRLAEAIEAAGADPWRLVVGMTDGEKAP